MKIVRDGLGHICQINMDDGSEIPSDEIKTAFETIAEDEKEITARVIAKEKEITSRQKNRCDFWKDSIPNIANSIATALINQFENNGENFCVQEPDPMPPYDDQEVKR